MRIAVFGKTHGGKTYWVYHTIYSEFKGTRIFIDPKPSYYVRPTKKTGVKIPSIKKLKKKHDEIILVPHFSYDYTTEVRRLLQFIIYQKIRRKDNKKILIVIDEFHRFSTKHKSLPELDKIINEGEAHGISTVMIIQHPNRLPDQYILNSEIVVLFGNSKILIDYISDKIEFPIDSTEHELAKGHLSKPYHGVYWDYREVQLIVPSNQDKGKTRKQRSKTKK